MSNFELSIRFFLQVAFILTACRGLGFLARRLGQPQVVAEMAAGVLMGPSLFGLLLPELQQQIFPKASMPIICALSHTGIALYMFLVGVEFQGDLIRKRLRSAASVSLAGIFVPFTLGGLLGMGLANNRAFFAEGVAGWESVLFVGAAMSITAFPMLARIIYDRGLAGTSLGTLALAAGSIDDAAAWCIFALVLASFSGSALVAASAIGGGAAYTLLVFLVAKPLLGRLARSAERDGRMGTGRFSLMLTVVMLAAWVTDAIGIYAVFGTFILGTAIPRGSFGRELEEKIRPLTTSLLLPLFFVYSGLNTRIGAIDSPSMWALALFILLAACLGKGVACWLAARLNGESNAEAMAIGTLMNARGLMELILLNIGLERRIITPALFTILVTMAIATTLMASPLFELVYRRRAAAPAFQSIVGAAYSPHSQGVNE